MEPLKVQELSLIRVIALTPQCGPSLIPGRVPGHYLARGEDYEGLAHGFRKKKGGLTSLALSTPQRPLIYTTNLIWLENLTLAQGLHAKLTSRDYFLKIKIFKPYNIL